MWRYSCVIVLVICASTGCQKALSEQPDATKKIDPETKKPAQAPATSEPVHTAVVKLDEDNAGFLRAFAREVAQFKKDTVDPPFKNI